MKHLDKTNWERVEFGEIARSLNTTVRDPQAAGIERVVGMEHIDSSSLHIKSWGSITDGTTFTRTFQPGQVLFGKRRAYQRKAAVADFAGLCSGDILVLEAKEERLMPELLPFLVHSDGFFDHAVRTSAGSLSPRTKFKDLAEYEFLMPPRHQQARLAELFWAADEVLQSYNTICLALEQVNASYNQSLFANGSELVEYKLGELATVKRGKFSHRPRNDPRFFGGVIPFIQTGDVVKAGDGEILDYSQTLNELGMSVSKLFVRGTIVMTITGANTGEVGILGLDAAFPDSLVGIEPKPEKINKDYLLRLLRSSKQRLMQNATKNTQENLNIEIISNLPFAIHDSTQQQQQVMHYFEQLDSSKRDIQASQVQAQSVLQALINQIFSA